MLGRVGAVRKELVERALLCGLLGCPRRGRREVIGPGCPQCLLKLAKAIQRSDFEDHFELRDGL